MSIKLKKIDSQDFNYSNIGDASVKRYLYLIDKKKHLDNILKGKKRKKLIEDDFLDQEEKDEFDEMYEKDEGEEDIFNKDYKKKYLKMKEEERKKFFNLKNSCSFSNSKRQKEIRNEGNNKDQLLNKYNENKYKYHLVHHYRDLYESKYLSNANAAEPSCPTYNPKMEYLYKKIIYSPEFKKMSGRYDLDKLKKKVRLQLEKNLKEKKEKESKNNKMKKITKIRSLISISRRESLKDFRTKPISKSQRYLSVGENKKNNLISIFKRPLKDKLIFQKKEQMNHKEQVNSNESRNLNMKLNSIIDKRQGMSLGFNDKSKRSSFNIKNSYEDLNEEINSDSNDKRRINLSNCVEGNTLSSANQHKLSSGKKDNSFNYQNDETDLIYPSCINSKNEQIIKIHINDFDDNKDINDNNNEDSLSKKRESIQNNIDINNETNALPSLNNNLNYNNVVDFEKMLPREYFQKLNKKKSTLLSTLYPKYDLVHPKCIMKVIYSQKKHNKKHYSQFKATFNESLLDIDKYYYRYNNHIGPKDILLDKMKGRELNKKSPLPSFMFNQCDRNSFNTFNNKNLEMNCYAKGGLKELKSSFNDKKTFNYKLIEQQNTKNNNFTEDMNSIIRKINHTNSINYEIKEYESHSNNEVNTFKKDRKNSPIKLRISEYYKVNLDKIGRYPFNSWEKIDGFSLKTIKNSKSALNLFSNRERKIFLSKLDD